MLRDTFKDALEGIGCPNKYVISEAPGVVPNCPLSQQSYYWEKDDGKNLTEKHYQRTCLNFNCCKLTANYNLRWYYRLITSTIGLVFFGVLLAGGSLQHSSESSTNNKDSYRIYQILGLLLLIILIVVMIDLIFLLIDPLTLQRDSNEAILAKDLSYSNLTDLWYYPDDLKPELRDCTLLKNYLPVEGLPINYNLNNCNGSLCSNLTLRVGLYVSLTQARLIFKNGANVEHVRIYPHQEASKYFADLGPQGSSVLLEGQPEHIRDLIENELSYCPVEVFSTKGALNVRLFQFVPETPKKSLAKRGIVNNNREQENKPEKEEGVRHHRLNLEKQIDGKVTLAKSHQTDSETIAFMKKYEKNFFSRVGGSWGSFEFIVLDALTGKNLTGVEIYVYRGRRACLQENSGDFANLGQTNSTGRFVAYNMHHANYTVQFHLKGKALMSFSEYNAFKKKSIKILG